MFLQTAKVQKRGAAKHIPMKKYQEKVLLPKND